MRARAPLVLAALLLVVGLVVSRPLAREWADGFPITAGEVGERAVLIRAPGDTLQLYYQLWLTRDGLIGPTPLFRDPYQFRTNGPRWNLPQSFLALAIPFVLLSPLGPHIAYNLLVLLSFPLAGLAVYGLVRHYTGSVLGAATAGVGFALVPARLGPLFGGQPAGFAAVLIPLSVWGLDLALTRGSLRGALGGGAALFALATLEPHYTYLMAALLPVYLVVRWATAARRRPIPWGPLLAFALLALAGAGWLWMLRQVFLVGSVAEAGRSLAEVRLYSPGPAALLVPATYGGIGLVALALVGLAAGGREARALRLLYGGLFVIGLVLSLGPTLPKLPVYQALHRWVPLFGLIRNPDKFRILVSLGAAVLAGYAARTLGARFSPAAVGPVGAALLAAITASTAPWHPIVLTRIPDSPVYTAARAEARRVLYLPIWSGESAWSSIHLYGVTRTRVPMLNGYSPLVPRAYATEIALPLQGLNVGNVDQAAASLLRRLGVTHIVLDRALFPPQVSPFPSGFTLERLRTAPALELRQGDDPLWLFRLGPEVAADQPRATSPVGVFHEAESLPRRTGVTVEDGAASAGRAVVGRPGIDRPELLTFGPYRLLPAGAYRARFRVRGHGLTVEVTVDEGRRALAQSQVPPQEVWSIESLRFVLDTAQPVEFRVRWDGQGEAGVDWVAATFADRPDPEWTFAVRELPHRLGERQDPQASTGWAGYADPEESQRADLVSGPARLYPAGRYRLTLRARAVMAVRGPILRLAVTEPVGRLLASRTVDASELPPGGYRDVTLAFRLAQPTVVECPIGYLGRTGIFFDRLTIAPE